MYNIKVDHNDGNGFGDHITFEVNAEGEEDMQVEIITLLDASYKVQIEVLTDED